MRYLTSGESHGPQLTVIVEGVPANLEIKVEDINKEMFKRQGGYGRGRRMQIEKDTVEIVSGVRNGYTLGSPITMVITNDDFTLAKNYGRCANKRRRTRKYETYNYETKTGTCRFSWRYEI